MICVRQLGCYAGGSRLLGGVNFNLEPGEVLVVCGPNGAGKSTLLKCLAGQIHPDEGEILYGGISMRGIGPEVIAKCRAVLPQAGAIPFDFTSEEVVAMGRIPHGGGAGVLAERKIVWEALELADAFHLRERVVTSLSGGELQRVHLARVLAQIWEPEPGWMRVLLLDEPISALDLRHQLHLLRVVQDWAGRGVAALVILHDLNLAACFATRVLLLKGGRVQVEGTPDEVFIPEQIEEVFGLKMEVFTTGSGRRFLVPRQLELPSYL